MSAALLGGAYLGGSVRAGSQAHASGSTDDTQKAAIGEIYQLQAAFHRAKTLQDIDLMMSLWAPDGTLTVRGNHAKSYVGTDALREFWLNSGSFTHKRFSLVPSFKTQIDVHGATAYLYFECHDVGSYSDPTLRNIASDTFLAGTVEFLNGNWVFYHMTAGPSAPLSPTTYYYP